MSTTRAVRSSARRSRGGGRQARNRGSAPNPTGDRSRVRRSQLGPRITQPLDLRRVRDEQAQSPTSVALRRPSAAGWLWPRNALMTKLSPAWSPSGAPHTTKGPASPEDLAADFATPRKQTQHNLPPPATAVRRSTWLLRISGCPAFWLPFACSAFSRRWESRDTPGRWESRDTPGRWAYSDTSTEPNPSSSGWAAGSPDALGVAFAKTADQTRRASRAEPPVLDGPGSWLVTSSTSSRVERHDLGIRGTLPGLPSRFQFAGEPFHR